MTIHGAFNEITETLGGTPSTDGTITGAIDALNDTLAGENQERGISIEDGIRLLGEHIGSGRNSEFSTVFVTFTNTSNDHYFSFSNDSSYPYLLLYVTRNAGGAITSLSQISGNTTVPSSASSTYEFLKIADIDVMIKLSNINSEPSLEGDIEIADEPYYAVSGNCTITAAGNELPK